MTKMTLPERNPPPSTRCHTRLNRRLRQVPCPYPVRTQPHGSPRRDRDRDISIFPEKLKDRICRGRLRPKIHTSSHEASTPSLVRLVPSRRSRFPGLNSPATAFHPISSTRENSCGLGRSTATPWPMSSMPFGRAGIELRPRSLRSSVPSCVPSPLQLLVADHPPVRHPLPEGVEDLLLEATRLLISGDLYLPLSKRPEGGVEPERPAAREQ